MLDFIKKHLNWIMAISLSMLNIALSSRYMGFVMFDPDPWIALYGAKRILEGQLLYKNFFDFITPGTDYMLAGVFYIFGLKLTVAHMAVILANAIVVSIVVFISFDMIKNKWLGLLPGLLFSLYSPYYYYVSHHWFILLPVILALLTGTKNVKEHAHKTHNWFFTGLATAGAFLFIQSIGFTLFGMILLFIIWYYTADRLRVKPILQPLLYYSAGFMIPLILVVICFALSGSLGAFIYDSFLWPFSHYRVINLSTPYAILRLLVRELSSEGIIMGLIYAFIAYFGIVLSFISFLHAVINLQKKKSAELSLMAFVSFFCMGIIIGLLPNPPAFHLMVFLPVYMLAVIVIFEYAPFWSSRIVRAGFYFYFVSITVVISYNAYRFFIAYSRPLNAVEAFQTPIGKVKMFKEYKYLPISYPYSFLNELPMKLPKYIFVMYWSPSIYLLTGTDNPTPLNTYMPYYNTKGQAMSVIQALKSNHTDLVIMDNAIEFVKHIGWWVQDPRVFSPDDPIVKYINSHYRLEKIIPGYRIYRLMSPVKKNEALPPPCL